MEQTRNKIPMSLKLDPQLWDVLQVLRKEMDRTQNWLIENALRQTYDETLTEIEEQPDSMPA